MAEKASAPSSRACIEFCRRILKESLEPPYPPYDEVDGVSTVELSFVSAEHLMFPNSVEPRKVDL